MDPLRNPFSPGAGAPPRELAGRTDILNFAGTTLARIQTGRSGQGILLVGLRGVGKTVLLRQIEKHAKGLGYYTVPVEASEDKPLALLLLSHLRTILLELDAGVQVSQRVKKGLRIFKSFLNGLKVKYHDIEIGVDTPPQPGAADSGDLDADLTAVFVALGEAAADRKTAIALVIDELQYVGVKELGALFMAFHRISQLQLPLIVVGAGLPQLVGDAGRAKSYAERLFRFPRVGPLNAEDAEKALREPVRAQGVDFTSEAVAAIFRSTQGYPYFLQEWGSKAWDVAESSPIDIEAIGKAADAVVRDLDENFFQVRFDRLSRAEKTYLRALAELGPDKQRSGAVAALLGRDSRAFGTLRDGLIRKGMIYSPEHGTAAFTVPLFDQFMKRIMPDLPKPPGRPLNKKRR